MSGGEAAAYVWAKGHPFQTPGCLTAWGLGALTGEVAQPGRDRPVSWTAFLYIQIHEPGEKELIWMWYFGPLGWPPRWVWGGAAVVSVGLLVLYGLTGSAIPGAIAVLVALVLAARATTARFRGMGDLGEPPERDDKG